MTIKTCQICNNDIATAGTDEPLFSYVDGWTQAAPVAKNSAYVVEKRVLGVGAEQARQMLEVLNGISKEE